MSRLMINRDGEIETIKQTVTILNVGAGRILPIDIDNFENSFVVNLDSSYVSGKSIRSIDEIENYHRNSFLRKVSRKHAVRCNNDAFYFLESYKSKFDMITAYRFLEHVEFTKVAYFIYLLSQVIEVDGIVDVIVPDYSKLASMLLKEEIESPDFEAHNILLTTELLNDPSDPHASVWTRDRLEYYFQLEKRFILEHIEENFYFENRTVYIRAMFRRI